LHPTLYTTSLKTLNLYVMSTERIDVLYGTQNKKWLFLYTVLNDWLYNRDGACLLRSKNLTLNYMI
jgi:hypothetical protein